MTTVGRGSNQSFDRQIPDMTGGATHYHANWVNPSWAQQFPQTAEIGVHLFYLGR